ncbi:hypothetical protein [Vibrio nigripulchritudo]|uniref:hypothetical protein n=1 Tax=Vibrio nigripulchritudo TaxID=28173 RepID=UPI0011AE3495|nr:hypothetical protein [Vibrio nigripulchritudo]
MNSNPKNRFLNLLIFRRLVLLIITPTLILSFAGCERKSDCYVSEAVTFLKKIEFESGTLFLYERTSGMSDKMSIVELYREQPSFDECGHPDTESVSQVPLDIDGNQPTAITVSENFVDIKYNDQPYSGQKVEDLKVEVFKH